METRYRAQSALSSYQDTDDMQQTFGKIRRQTFNPSRLISGVESPKCLQIRINDLVREKREEFDKRVLLQTELESIRADSDMRLLSSQERISNQERTIKS